jgi:hypothetical protein
MFLFVMIVFLFATSRRDEMIVGHLVMSINAVSYFLEVMMPTIRFEANFANPFLQLLTHCLLELKVNINLNLIFKFKSK